MELGLGNGTRLGEWRLFYVSDVPRRKLATLFGNADLGMERVLL